MYSQPLSYSVAAPVAPVAVTTSAPLSGPMRTLAPVTYVSTPPMSYTQPAPLMPLSQSQMGQHGALPPIEFKPLHLKTWPFRGENLQILKENLENA